MKNIGLHEITEEHLLGEWHVENRFNITNDTSSIFSKNNRLIFEQNSYLAINGLNVSGEWSVSMKTELIYNPLLTFYVEKKLIAEAIITRLIISEEDYLNKKNAFVLTLYFTNGLELILNKKS
ncbi:MAG: hypothetical protein K0R26_1266 [Bacteroidota bacterium]|jgi:hypothetical protein|nr:hypothetical protein [Bacteroidota bacterium]